MGLPFVIEYLLTMERPGGGHLLHQGVSQTIIPAIPPNTQFVLQTLPFGTDYLDIVYASYVDLAVVPNAFYGWGQYYGARSYEGTLTAGFIANPIDSFVIISRSEPAMALIQNQTALNQYYAGIVYFLSVASEDDFNLITEALARIGTSAKSEQLAMEANQLLRQLTLSAPKPSIVEGGV